MASSLCVLATGISRVAVVFLVLHMFVSKPSADAAGDDSYLTAGFTKVDLPEGNFVVQSPYDVPGHDYSSGVWQFEGYGYVPSGTSGVSVM